MKLQITNQRPVTLTQTKHLMPSIDPSASPSDFMDKRTKWLKALMVTPLFLPINKAQPVQIIDTTVAAQKIPLSPDELLNALVSLTDSEFIDPQLTDEWRTVLQASMRYTLPNHYGVENQLAIERMAMQKQPLPSATILYTPQRDLIPAAKDLIIDFTADHINSFVTGFIGFMLEKALKNEVLFVAVKGDAEYQKIQNQFAAFLSKNQNALDPDVRKNLSDIRQIQLGSELTATWLAPDPDYSANSFTRIVQYLIAKNLADPAAASFAIPLNLNTLMKTRHITFINIEAWSHATPKEIMDSLRDINKAVMRLKTFNAVSMKHLSSAQAVNQAASKGSGFYANKRDRNIMKIAHRAFGGKAFTSEQQIRIMAKIIRSRISTKQSQNVFKREKGSYMRANRRHPDDFNLKGKVRFTRYRPDIHIFLDGSGSVSESNYKDAVINLIRLTKRINTNLYFSSFANSVAAPVLLQIKNRSVSHIYKTFSGLPKVTGGTDYENVWDMADYIDAWNEKNGRSYRVNFLITDFEYRPRSSRVMNAKHASVKNMFYVPISTDTSGYKQLLYAANTFADAMIQIGDVGIRNRMLL